MCPGNGERAAPEQLYLDLLKRCLTRQLVGERFWPLQPRKDTWRWKAYVPLDKVLQAARLQLVRPVRFDVEARATGSDYPADAETMIGLRRLDNLENCIVDVLRQDVPGDLIETGVWRGGATILMRAVLKAHGDTTRTVWAADSFQGLPKPDPGSYPADDADRHWTRPELVVSLDEVRANFEHYGLLDDQVRFLPGWFRDTLPNAPIERLAVLRLDGDMYESTFEALRALYPKLSPRGYAIIDDYGAIPSCRMAVEDFRAEHGINEELKTIDGTGVFWQRRDRSH